MLSKPLLIGLSDKFYDIALIILVTIMYIALCAEADMYVPAFPQMIEYFGVAENKIQLILSINFGGLCIAGLLTGPLSDSFGRRRVLLGGLGLFVVSSLGCVYTDSFIIMLLWRFLQGIAASVPMVVGVATFLDKYSSERAGQLIGIINSVISASMAGAPIVGAWVSQIFDWRANFVAILALAVISFLGTLFFIEETLPKEKRRQFRLSIIISDYIKLLQSFEFIAYSTIGISVFTCVLVYVANLSVIFVNHMGMSLEEFSYWQASTMGTFIVFSLLSVKLIDSKGLDYTQNLGCVLALIGAVIIFYISQINHNNVPMICLSMAFIAAGGALFGGAFGVKAMSIFPEINGAAGAMMTAVRQILALGLVTISEVMFDGTIVPVAKIIFGYAIVATVLYTIVFIKHSKRAKG